MNELFSMVDILDSILDADDARSKAEEHKRLLVERIDLLAKDMYADYINNMDIREDYFL